MTLCKVKPLIRLRTLKNPYGKFSNTLSFCKGFLTITFQNVKSVDLDKNNFHFILQIEKLSLSLYCQIKTMEVIMKFKVNGYEVEDYQLSNDEILSLVKGDTITDEERAFLTKKIVDRFEYDLCPRKGENEDSVFVRFFSNFVNGKMCSKRDVANGLAREHRYLQQEMFKVCLEYIKVLAENCEKGFYDPRNEWSCKTSKLIVDLLKENDYII